MARAGPDFTDLGVTDPTTGKPVYLSAGEISQVMGATGGVAPTKFQAGTEGFFKGVGQGQQIVSNVLTSMQQYENIGATRADTEAQEISNDIQRQTKDAQIAARNNQIKQQSIQAQMQTDKLMADNRVLDAVRSGDPQQLIEVIQNPSTMLSAIENDQFVESAFQRIQQSNGFTPQQVQTFEKFKTTRDIFKQGPLQEQYQAAAAGITGTVPFQQLKAQTGMNTDALLQGVKIQQAQTPWGPATVLAAPDGSHVILDDTSKDKESLGAFFSARDRLENAGRFKPPGLAGTSAPAGELKAQPSLPLSSIPGSVSGTPPAAKLPGQEAPAHITEVPGPNQIQQNGAAPQQQGQAAALPGQPTATPTGQPQVNPNDVAPNGQPLQFQVPQLEGMNKALTPTGESVSAKTMREAQKIYAQGGGKITPKDALATATRIALKEADLSKQAKQANSKTTGLAQEYRDMAAGIRGAVSQAEETGLALGPTWADTYSRTGTTFDTTFDPELREQVGGAQNKFDTLASQYGFTIMKKDGLAAQVINSNAERELLQAGGPRLTKTKEENLAVADQMDSYATLLQDKADLTSYFNVLKIPDDQAAVLINEFQAANPAMVMDESVHGLRLNRNRQNPVAWANDRLGIADDAATNAFANPTSSTPTQSAPQQTPAAGSGTATPFAPAKKQDASPFPQAQGNPMARGANYNATPATVKDLKAIAQTAEQGGNLRQFQTGGSVPFKLDKATPDLVSRVIGAESLPGKAPGSVNVNSVSPTGVKGAMMVTKATFSEVAPEVEAETGETLTDRKDATQSVMAGTQYLNKMLKRFDGNVDMALAAYNAGPETVQNILDDLDIPVERATIDHIDKFLPNTQPTGKYVRKITSRGRVAPDAPEGQPQQPKGKGFFDNFQLQDLNPFGASVAQAEEPGVEFISSETGKPVPRGGTDTGNVIGDIIPDPQGANLPTGGAAANSISETIPGIPNVNPTSPTEAAPPATTDSVVKVPKAENSPRNDVPPPAEIQAALQNAKEDIGIATSAFPAAGRAVKFIRNSAVGRWLGELQNTKAFDIGENFTNAVTFGLYDEGMGTLESSMGFDGTLMRDEIRQNLKEFRAENPRTAMASDILGSVAGGGGAGMVLRALRGVNAARTTIQGMTLKEGAKIGAAQAGARGFGEGESTGQRLMGGAAGVAVGGVLGAGASLIPKIPVVGGAAAMGAGGGAVVGGVTGGQGSDVVEGAVQGAGLMTAGRLGVKFSPMIQRAITSTVTKLNNDLGLKALGTMVNKVLTGKTPAETAATLDGSESLILDQLQHLPRGQLKSMLHELKNSSNPQIPVRLFDVMKDADMNTLVKAMSQLKGNKEVSAKIGKFLQERMAGQNVRLDAEIGPQELVEQSARRVINLIQSTKKGATSEAITAAEPLYKQAQQLTPVFDSPKIKQIMSTPAMKDALAAARADVEATMVKPAQEKARDAGIITDLSNKMFDRVKAGQPIDDLVQQTSKADVSKLPDNSFQILTEARRKLGQQMDDPATSNTLKRELGIMHKELSQEMDTLNPAFAEANAAYESKLARVDMLKENTSIQAIENLAHGNVQQALPKVLRMPSKDLEAFMGIIDDPKAFQDVARGFLRQRLDQARGQGDVASKLIAKGEWKNIETLLGVDETAALKATIDAESKIAKSGRSVVGGSDTVPKAQAAQTLDEISGQNTSPFETAASVVGGSKMSILANSIKAVLRGFVPKGNPEAIVELADTLVLSAPKGIQAMENILKSRGLQKAELRRLRPYLQQWQDTLRGGGLATTTSLVGQLTAGTQRKRKKK